MRKSAVRSVARRCCSMTAPARFAGPPSPRIALVIGGAGGIGAAICRNLARVGNVIAVADIDGDAANDVALSLGHGSHAGFSTDVRQEAAVEALFASAEAAIGDIAILVYVAGGPLVDPSQPQQIAQTSVDNWEQTETLNARGLFLATRAFFRRREVRPVAQARLITIGSMAGVAPSGLHTGVAYAASKAAAINLTRFAALEGAPLGITANAIAPGTILTDTVRAQLTPEQIAAIARETPVGRIGRPENIAAAVEFLAAPDADFMTGCVLEVNGGRHMG